MHRGVRYGIGGGTLSVESALAVADVVDSKHLEGKVVLVHGYAAYDGEKVETPFGNRPAIVLVITDFITSTIMGTPDDATFRAVAAVNFYIADGAGSFLLVDVDGGGSKWTMKMGETHVENNIEYDSRVKPARIVSGGPLGQKEFQTPKPDAATWWRTFGKQIPVSQLQDKRSHGGLGQFHVIKERSLVVGDAVAAIGKIHFATRGPVLTPCEGCLITNLPMQRFGLGVRKPLRSLRKGYAKSYKFVMRPLGGPKRDHIVDEDLEDSKEEERIEKKKERVAALGVDLINKLQERLRVANKEKGLRKLCDKYDKDKSGNLSGRELKRIVRLELRIGTKMLLDEDIDALVAALDDDGGGELSVEELMDFVINGAETFFVDTTAETKHKQQAEVEQLRRQVEQETEEAEEIAKIYKDAKAKAAAKAKVWAAKAKELAAMQANTEPKNMAAANSAAHAAAEESAKEEAGVSVILGVTEADSWVTPEMETSATGESAAKDKAETRAKLEEEASTTRVVALQVDIARVMADLRKELTVAEAEATNESQANEIQPPQPPKQLGWFACCSSCHPADDDAGDEEPQRVP